MDSHILLTGTEFDQLCTGTLNVEAQTGRLHLAKYRGDNSGVAVMQNEHSLVNT